MAVEVKREDGEVTLTITIPAEKVKMAFAELKEAALKELFIPGFRKGKAPEEIASKHLDEDKLAEELFRQLVPPAYGEALEKEGVKPIVAPQIAIKTYQKDKDLVFGAKTAEKPEIKLGDYKAALTKLKGKIIYGPDGLPARLAESKRAGKAGKPLSAQGGTGGAKVTAAQALEALRGAIDFRVPPIIIDQEVQRMMSSLLNQAQTLGITIDQYLASQGKSADQLRKEYRETAEGNIKDELIVSEITKEEGIAPTPQEVEDTVKAAPDEKTKEAFNTPQGKAYIEEILRKRKTIEFLLRVAEGK